MAAPGDLRELTIQREEVPDGVGGVVRGLAVRLWLEPPADREGDVDLALTVLVSEPGLRAGYGDLVREDVILHGLRMLELA